MLCGSCNEKISDLICLMDCKHNCSDKKTLKSNSPVLTDSPMTKSRLGISSSLAPYTPVATPFPSSGMYLTVPRRKLSGKVDDVRANAWLDAMISSSPPRKKLNKDFISETASDDTDAAYTSWMVTYPSALTSFEQITSHARDKKIALFLDYDGTLSHIVDNPDDAFMSPTMRAAVKGVAEYFPTTIISGRSRDKVFDFVKLTELYYAGSHGMDIMGPVRESEFVGNHPDCIRTTDQQGKEVHLFQPASKFLPMIDEVFVSLTELTKDIVGSRVENNKFCVSVHYRQVEMKYFHEIARRVQEFLKNYPCLRVSHGRKVLEVRPVIDWNKGKAVEFLLESLGLDDTDDVLPIYIGDDRTDEDAFKVLKDSNRGFGILVSSKPKETNAFYSLRDPPEVMQFLKSLVRWKRSLA